MVWGAIARGLARAFSRSSGARRIITSSKSYARRISSGLRGRGAKTTSRVSSAYRYSRSMLSQNRSDSKKSGSGQRRRRMVDEYAYKY